MWLPMCCNLFELGRFELGFLYKRVCSDRPRQGHHGGYGEIPGAETARGETNQVRRGHHYQQFFPSFNVDDFDEG